MTGKYFQQGLLDLSHLIDVVITKSISCSSETTKEENSKTKFTFVTADVAVVQLNRGSLLCAGNESVFC